MDPSPSDRIPDPGSRIPIHRRWIAATLLAALALLRHDLWWWSDDSLVLGLPIGLLSQIVVCLLAAPLLAYAFDAFARAEGDA